MHALVTGAGGLIGSNVVRALAARGIGIRAMLRNRAAAKVLHGTGAEVCQGDVLASPTHLTDLMRGCDFVFHAAAHFRYARIDEAELERTAVQGTRNVLVAAAAAGVGRVIVTSSSVVCGSSSTPSVRDEAALPESDFIEPAYVRSKVKQAAIAIAEASALGLEVLLVCPTMSLGYPATTLGPSNAIVTAYLQDPLRMTYPGGCNLVSVRDVAEGHCLVAERGEPGQRYLLGSENLHWPEIHRLIAELCGVEGPLIKINHTAAYLASAYEELHANVQRREPLTTREQARMVGRYYWYSHASAAALGYAPQPARTALAEACACLAASPHVSREIRATITLHPDVYAARLANAATWN